MDANVEQAVGCPMAELVLVKRTTEPVRKISSSLIAKMVRNNLYNRLAI